MNVDEAKAYVRQDQWSGELRDILTRNSQAGCVLADELERVSKRLDEAIVMADELAKLAEEQK